MSAQYSCYISDTFGVRLGDASSFISLKYSRVVNTISTAYLTLPESFDQSLLRIPDGRLEIWRQVDNGPQYLDTETIWLIKAVEYSRDQDGKRTLLVEADTPLSIIGEPGRVAFAYSAEYANTIVSGPADDLIRTAVINATGAPGASYGTNRDLTGYLSYARGQSAGATVAKSYGWRNILRTCQELAEASATLGVYVAFDIVAPTLNTLEFRTYTQQRGVDHRYPGGANPVLLSPDLGNLADTTLRKDYRPMASHVWCGGKGEGSIRVIGDRQSLIRIGLSPFGAREKFIEEANSADTTTLNNEADAELRASRERVTFQGKIVPTKDTQYGVHWAWGDYVTAQDFGQSFDCRIDAITVTVQGGQEQSETIEAYTRAEP